MSTRWTGDGRGVDGGRRRDGEDEVVQVSGSSVGLVVRQYCAPCVASREGGLGGGREESCFRERSFSRAHPNVVRAYQMDQNNILMMIDHPGSP